MGFLIIWFISSQPDISQTQTAREGGERRDSELRVRGQAEEGSQNETGSAVRKRTMDAWGNRIVLYCLGAGQTK